MADSMTFEERRLENQGPEPPFFFSVAERRAIIKNRLCESYVSAQSVIEALEHEMDCLQFLPGLKNASGESSSGAISNTFFSIDIRFTNIAPTEIENTPGFSGSGPAVLTARLGVPPDLVYTPGCVSTLLHRTYTLSRQPYSLLLGEGPATGSLPAEDRIARVHSPYVSAQRVIEALEYDMGWLQFLPHFDNNAILGTISLITVRFNNIAPTEIRSIIGPNGSGPAILTARIYIPQNFTYIPDSMTSLRRTYVLSRPRSTVLLCERPARLPGPAFLPDVPRFIPWGCQQPDEEQSTSTPIDLEMQHLTIFDLEELDQE